MLSRTWSPFKITSNCVLAKFCVTKMGLALPANNHPKPPNHVAKCVIILGHGFERFLVQKPNSWDPLVKYIGRTASWDYYFSDKTGVSSFLSLYNMFSFVLHMIFDSCFITLMVEEDLIWLVLVSFLNDKKITADLCRLFITDKIYFQIRCYMTPIVDSLQHARRNYVYE